MAPDALPRGPEDALAGEVFVLTGTLPTLLREDADAFIKRHGGRVTLALSSRTSFLVARCE